MRFAITGATGFTGGALATRLAREGHHVRCLARSQDHLPAEANIVPIVGEFDQDGVIEQLVEGCDCVIHTAAMFRENGTREEFERVNEGMTRALLRGARAAGVKRFVHLSTVGVHGSVSTVPADENAAFDPQDDYQETKLSAEQFCRAEMAAASPEIVIIRPCAIYGPGDTRMLKMFRMVQSRVFFFVGSFDAWFHAVYIDDLVDAILLAARAPNAAGETFIIGGARYYRLQEFVERVAQAVGARPPWIRLPWAPMYAAATLIEKMGLVFGFQPPLHRRRLKFFKHDRAFSIEHARDVLGYEPKVPLDEGLARTAAAYREAGMLR